MWEQIRSRVRGIYYAVTSEAVPIHRREKQSPFFIVGSGRCGTTLLRRILQASPEVHIPPENWGLGHVIRSFRQNRWLLDWDQLVEIVVASHQHKTHGWFEVIDDPIELFDELLDWPQSERSLYRLVDRLYRYHGEKVGAEFSRWGDKTPLNVNHMDAILKAFPDAKFVNLVRDGVDVIHSWLKRPDYFGDMIRPARRWQGAVRAAREFSRRHQDRVIEVRYEELCRDPETITRKVCRFLDLSWEADLLSRSDHYDEMPKDQSVEHFENAFRPISTENIGKGRRNLPADQKETLAPLIDDLLVESGYNAVHE